MDSSPGNILGDIFTILNFTLLLYFPFSRNIILLLYDKYQVLDIVCTTWGEISIMKCWSGYEDKYNVILNKMNPGYQKLGWQG